MNGRMDLSQAEAVIDIIDAESAEAAKNAAGSWAAPCSGKWTASMHRLGISAHIFMLCWIFRTRISRNSGWRSIGARWNPLLRSSRRLRRPFPEAG